MVGLDLVPVDVLVFEVDVWLDVVIVDVDGIDAIVWDAGSFVL